MVVSIVDHEAFTKVVSAVCATMGEEDAAPESKSGEVRRAILSKIVENCRRAGPFVSAGAQTSSNGFKIGPGQGWDGGGVWRRARVGLAGRGKSKGGSMTSHKRVGAIRTRWTPWTAVSIRNGIHEESES